MVYPFAFNAQGGTPHIQTRGIDATVAADVLFAQAPAFDRCAAQRTDAAAPMDTALRIRIRTDGTVDTAEHVGLRPANDAVDACVEDVAKGLRFPPSSRPAVVAYPMQLRPPAAAPAPDAPSTPSSSTSTSQPSSSTSSTSSTSQSRSCAWP